MRAPLLHLLLLLLPFVFATLSPPRLASAAAAVEARKALLGGWRPIKDLKDPHVIEIAKFAVSEHNKEEKVALAFSKVVRGESQVVAGVNYRLVIQAKDGKAVADYEAVVWEKAWLNFRQLTSFKLVKE